MLSSRTHEISRQLQRVERGRIGRYVQFEKLQLAEEAREFGRNDSALTGESGMGLFRHGAEIRPKPARLRRRDGQGISGCFCVELEKFCGSNCRCDIEYLMYAPLRAAGYMSQKPADQFQKRRSKATSTNIQFAIFNFQFRLVRVRVSPS